MRAALRASAYGCRRQENKCGSAAPHDHLLALKGDPDRDIVFPIGNSPKMRFSNKANSCMA
jgi:hypothetical protein